MAKEEIIRAVLDASPAMRKKIEDVLNGRDQTPAKAEPCNTGLTSIRNAAKLLKVCRGSVAKLIKAGSLVAVDLNGRPRVTMQSIMDYTRGNR